MAMALIALIPATALAIGSAVTDAASKVHHTTAVLNGRLDPEGDPGVTECKFEWGETLAYGNTAPCAEGNSFNVTSDVSATLGGLSPGVTYHFRLHIDTTSNGPFNGTDQSFRTIPVPTEHPLIASFGPTGTAGSSFNGEGTSPAMNETNGKLYVADKGIQAGKLYGFDASALPVFPGLSGFPLSTGGTTEFVMVIAVDNTGLGSAGNVYFVTESPDRSDELNGIDSSGTPLPGFPLHPTASSDSGGDISGVAVNAAGEVWMVLTSTSPAGLKSELLKYSPTGVPQGSFDLSFPGDGVPHRIALDSAENLYVSTYTGSFKSIWKLTAASGYTSGSKLPEPSTQVTAFAFDHSTEYLYAASFPGTVVVYDIPSGKLIDEFTNDEPSRGITVDPVNDAVYVGGNAKVKAYTSGAALTPPTATTGPASTITGSKSTLNGFVDPEGFPVVECKFEYGISAEFDIEGIFRESAPCDIDPGSGSGDVAVSAEVTGLTPNTSYSYRLVAASDSAAAKGESEVFATNPPPVVSAPEVEDVTHNSAKLNALINPKGYETTYHFEYGTTDAYGTKVPVPDANAGAGTGEVPVAINLAGLAPDTLYHWRLVAENINGVVAMTDQTFTTFGPAKAETTGSPIRTTTTAQLQGRVNPDGAPTAYRFEYGTEGPCDANPCVATPDRSAGSGDVYRFVAEQIEGLAPNTTYHYRVIAESATPGGPAIGEDVTVTTRTSDAPLSHGRFPGPVGSDRAYEQVSLSDTGGNPVFGAYAASDSGNRAFYRVSGGTPLSGQGSLQTPLYAERVETAPHQGSWRSENIAPPRPELIGSAWLEPAGPRDLSALVAQNNDTTSGRIAVWRLQPGQPAVKLLSPALADYFGPVAASEDASRVLVVLRGAQDPAHTPPNNSPNLYDISSGTPRFIGLMPNGSISSCGTEIAGSSAYNVIRARNFVSANGSLAFFRTSGCNENSLFVRDLLAEETKLISVEANLVKSVAGAAFFTTTKSLDASDSGGGDLYRYDIDEETSECVTCRVGGLQANVGPLRVMVAEDGSRAYFGSFSELIRGATSPGIYRVDVDSGDLAYVAPLGNGSGNTNLLEDTEAGGAITPDGSTLVFPSDKLALNTLGGQQNGGKLQLYRYDDRDRSVTCITCPQDGSEPSSAVSEKLISSGFTNDTGANRTALSADGTTFAFGSPNALLSADQNTARAGQEAKVGTDVYEWRDGRLLLVTDGLTNWPDGGPTVEAVTPSGRDIFFTAATQYTQDALDGFRRLYTARIGGGFEVPPPPKPCPLEVCQGTPKGAPEEQAPGSGTFAGPGNTTKASDRRPCPKGRHKARKAGKTRCVKSQGRGKAQQKKRQRAKHDRRNAR